MVQTLPTERSDALLPIRLRLPVAVVAALSAATTLILGLSVAGTSAPSAIDIWVRPKMSSLVSGVPSLPWAVVQAGNLVPMIVMAGLLAGLCWLLRRPFHAVLALSAPAMVGAATALLKPAIGRTFGGLLAFPSGHTAGVTALAMVAGLMVVSMAHSQLATAISVATALVVLAGAAIGLSVVAVNWHYPTDALGGFCTAIALVVTLAFIVDGLRVALSPNYARPQQ